MWAATQTQQAYSDHWAWNFWQDFRVNEVETSSAFRWLWFELRKQNPLFHRSFHQEHPEKTDLFINEEL